MGCSSSAPVGVPSGVPSRVPNTVPSNEPSRVPSSSVPSRGPRTQRAIDEDTRVPEALFLELLHAGHAARCRGRHVEVRWPGGARRLVRADRLKELQPELKFTKSPSEASTACCTEDGATACCTEDGASVDAASSPASVATPSGAGSGLCEMCHGTGQYLGVCPYCRGSGKMEVSL